MPKLFLNLTDEQKRTQLKTLLKMILRGNANGGIDLVEVNEKLIDMGFDQVTIDSTIQSLLSKGEISIL